MSAPHPLKANMKLTLDNTEIINILLAWAQKHFPEGDFNKADLSTYSYDPKVVFTCEEPTDEAL
jgi:hypothetical protein